MNLLKSAVIAFKHPKNVNHGLELEAVERVLSDGTISVKYLNNIALCLGYTLWEFIRLSSN